MKTIKNSCLILITAITLWNCAPLYDHYTFTQTEETKEGTLRLVEKGTTPFNEHTEAVAALKTRLETMVAYEKTKKRNEITVRMWQLLSGDEQLVGSYLKLWEQKGTLNEAFTEAAGMEMEEAFNLMLAYEKEKDKESKNALTEFIGKILTN